MQHRSAAPLPSLGISQPQTLSSASHRFCHLQAGLIQTLGFKRPKESDAIPAAAAGRARQQLLCSLQAAPSRVRKTFRVRRG